jgi:DNA-binding transcriptional LysR family regulator
MELRQLEQFVAVAELSSFTRAAQRLRIVQSGVSASIQGLEHELGARLFERGPRGVRLTPAGNALLPAARNTLDAARTAREAVTRIATGVAGEVQLGTMPSIDVIDLPALLARLRQDHPGITVRLRTSPSGSSGLTEELARGDLDAALVANDGSPVPGMRLTRLITVPIVVLLRRDHPLADRNAVALAELADEQFIDFPVGFGNRRIVDDAFTRLGLQRSVAVEVTDVTHAAGYVRHGLGVSLVPGLPTLPTTQPGGEVRSVVVHRPALPWVLSIGVSTARTTSAAAQALLDLIPRYTQVIEPAPSTSSGTDTTPDPLSDRRPNGTLG